MTAEAPNDDQRGRYKQQAAEYAAGLVQSGMVVGLGSGSTALLAVRRIGQLLAERALTGISGVPTSARVEAEARRLAIPLAALDAAPRIDLTIDGADEVDGDWNCIKGGGGALLREKIVAQSSGREIIIIDETKLSQRIGTRWPVPVEVVRFGWPWQRQYLESLGAEVRLRVQPDGRAYETDQGNLILDCRFGPIADPRQLGARLAERAGIVEHGMFLGLADELVVAGPQGVRHLQRPRKP